MIVFLALVGAITAFFGIVISVSAKYVTHETLGAVLWTGGLVTVAVAVAGHQVIQTLRTLPAALAAKIPPTPPPTVCGEKQVAPVVGEPAPASNSGEPTVVSTRTYLGLYYTILSDGTIRVRTKSGDYGFGSAEEFREHIAANREWWAQQAGRQV
ncbi:hypothetical protein ACJ4V0_11565 [Phreatobacter sp. HK31-P]